MILFVTLVVRDLTLVFSLLAVVWQVYSIACRVDSIGDIIFIIFSLSSLSIHFLVLISANLFQKLHIFGKIIAWFFSFTIIIRRAYGWIALNLNFGQTRLCFLGTLLLYILGRKGELKFCVYFGLYGLLDSFFPMIELLDFLFQLSLNWKLESPKKEVDKF